MREIFSATGRIGRLHYFLHSVSDLLFILFLILSWFYLSAYFHFVMDLQAMNLVISVIILIGSVIEMFATIKRFHDIGMSGWYVLWSFVPIVFFFFALLLLFKPGDSGYNKYGKHPQA